MPAWIISLLVSLALKVGIPAAIALIKKIFPKLAEFIDGILSPAILQALQDHVDAVKENKSERSDIVADTKQKLIQHFGVGNGSDLVTLREEEKDS